MSTLHEKTLARWAKSKVVFDKQAALRLVDNAPRSMDASDMLVWATNHPFLKLRRAAVPEGILPCPAQIIDISIKPPRRRGRGPRILDDDVYDAFPMLRKYVARGLCILETHAGSCEHQIVISAMKKFTGGPGDDDDLAELSDEDGDEQDTNSLRARWQHYFTEPSDTTVQLINSSKENGDSAHLGVALVSGKLYPVLGSKLVHLVISHPSDIDRYSDSEFKHAKGLARAFFKTQVAGRIGADNFHRFLEEMSKNHYTATFEYLDVAHQHVELFNFTQSTFRFIAFTSTSDLTLLCCNLPEGIETASKAFGFETMKISAHDVKEQDALFRAIRKTYGTEGSVVYYVNSENKVIGMVKKKTVWYIMVRALRERMKGLRMRVMRALENGQDLRQIEDSVKRNLRKMTRQKQEWLGYSEQVRAAWEELGSRMCEWLCTQLRKNAVSPEEIADMWPVVWNHFITECNLSDKIDLEGEENNRIRLE